MRRIIVVALLDKMQFQMALPVKLDAFFGKRLETLPPEIQTEAPLAAVQFRSVEFVLPHKLPRLAFRQKTIRMIFHGKCLHQSLLKQYLNHTLLIVNYALFIMN